MYIRFRQMQISDLRECLKHIRDRFLYSSQEINQLQEFWIKMLTDGGGKGAVIEDTTAEKGNRLLWCCFIVFVNQTEAYRLSNTRHETFGKFVLSEISSGRLPVLTLSDIRKANSSFGLNAVVLHSGSPAYARHPRTQSVILGEFGEFAQYQLSGYRLNDVLVESYSNATSTWLAGSGLTLRRQRRRSSMLATCLSDPTVSLYGMSAEEAATKPGSIMSTIFHYRKPVFHLTLVEQEMVIQAMTDDRYESLAESLSLAKVTITKRWQSIYEKIAAHEAGCRIFSLSPGSRDNGSQGEPAECDEPARRGSERKRQVVRYFRQHMEELRPMTQKIAEPPRQYFADVCL